MEKIWNEIKNWEIIISKNKEIIFTKRVTHNEAKKTIKEIQKDFSVLIWWYWLAQSRDIEVLEINRKSEDFTQSDIITIGSTFRKIWKYHEVIREYHKYWKIKPYKFEIWYYNEKWNLIILKNWFYTYDWK